MNVVLKEQSVGELINNFNIPSFYQVKTVGNMVRSVNFVGMGPLPYSFDVKCVP